MSLLTLYVSHPPKHHKTKLCFAGVEVVTPSCVIVTDGLRIALGVGFEIHDICCCCVFLYLLSEVARLFPKGDLILKLFLIHVSLRRNIQT